MPAAVFPAIFPASFEKLSNFDGPITIIEATATMASSAGPRPKKDRRQVVEVDVDDVLRFHRAREGVEGI